MGMYSSFENQDIKELDKEALRRVRFDLDGEDCDLITEDGVIDFMNWDNHKLESYWYDETRKTLTAISPYVEGYAEFHYEEGYNFRIIFKDKKVYVKRVELNWKNVTESDIIGCLNNKIIKWIKKEFVNIVKKK